MTYIVKQNMINYTTLNKIIIFDNNFNDIITNELSDLLSNYDTLIFSDFNSIQSTLKFYTRIYVEKEHKRYKPSKFNKPINNLPISIKKLFLGHSFNKELDNLPKNI